MHIYILSLINQNPNLNLEKEICRVARTLKYFRNHGHRRTSFQDFSEASILAIKSHYIILMVVETDTAWHKHFGRRFAQKPGMAAFRSPVNPKEMFDWDLIRSQEKLSRLL